MREEEGVCDCQEKHPSHICQLRAEGKIHECNQVTKYPNISCVNCGEAANSMEKVCRPVPLFV